MKHDGLLGKSQPAGECLPSGLVRSDGFFIQIMAGEETPIRKRENNVSAPSFRTKKTRTVEDFGFGAVRRRMRLLSHWSRKQIEANDVRFRHTMSSVGMLRLWYNLLRRDLLSLILTSHQQRMQRRHSILAEDKGNGNELCGCYNFHLYDMRLTHTLTSSEESERIL